MTKSEFKRILLTCAPECITRPDQDDTHGVVVVQDTCIALMANEFLRCAPRGNKAAAVTLDEASESLFAGSIRYLAHDPECLLWVHCFDKPHHVTAAKQPEQRKRDRGGAPKEEHGVPIRSLMTEGRHSGRAVASVREWEAAVRDRSAKRFLIKHLCERAVELMPGWLRKAGVDPKQQVLLDFDGIDASLIGAERAVLITVDGAQNRPDLCNRLGEFDVSHVHHLRSPLVVDTLAASQCPSPAIIVRSIDSDILLVNALQSQHAGYPPRVRIATTLPKSMTNEPTGMDVWIDPVGIASWATAALAGYSDPVGKLVEAYTLAGSDFVEGVPGKGSRKFVEEYLQWVALGDGDASPSTFLTGLVQRSANRKAGPAARLDKLASVDCGARAKRAEWVVGYWRYSAFDDTRVPNHLGMGFALKDGQHVYEEDLSL